MKKSKGQAKELFRLQVKDILTTHFGKIYPSWFLDDVLAEICECQYPMRRNKINIKRSQ